MGGVRSQGLPAAAGGRWGRHTPHRQCNPHVDCRQGRHRASGGARPVVASGRSVFVAPRSLRGAQVALWRWRFTCRVCACWFDWSLDSSHAAPRARCSAGCLQDRPPSPPRHLTQPPPPPPPPPPPGARSRSARRPRPRPGTAAPLCSRGCHGPPAPAQYSGVVPVVCFSAVSCIFLNRKKRLNQT